MTSEMLGTRELGLAVGVELALEHVGPLASSPLLLWLGLPLFSRLLLRLLLLLLLVGLGFLLFVVAAARFRRLVLFVRRWLERDRDGRGTAEVEGERG